MHMVLCAIYNICVYNTKYLYVQSYLCVCINGSMYIHSCTVLQSCYVVCSLSRR